MVKEYRERKKLRERGERGIDKKKSRYGEREQRVKDERERKRGEKERQHIMIDREERGWRQ